MGTISHAEWVQGVEQVRGWAAMCGHDGSFFEHTTKVAKVAKVAKKGLTAVCSVLFVVSFAPTWARRLAGGA
jgi:hypothetical protein